MHFNLYNKYINPSYSNFKNRFLVICFVGDNSLHRKWIEDKNRKFDIFLFYYGNIKDKYKYDGEYYIQSKGLKWPCLHIIIEQFYDLIFSYDAFWFPDDDISTNTASINELFNLLMKYALDLAQPALSEDSYYSHAITIQNKMFLLRYTNFIEAMAPMFTNKGLLKCWDTFNKSDSGWFLESAWSSNIKNKYKIGIIDLYPIKHSRVVMSGELYKNIRNSPYKDYYSVSKYYSTKLHNYHHRAYDGILNPSISNELLTIIPQEFLVLYMIILGTPSFVFNTYSFMGEIFIPSIMANGELTYLFEELDKDQELINICNSLADKFDIQLFVQLDEIRKKKHEILLETKIIKNLKGGGFFGRFFKSLESIKDNSCLSDEQIHNINYLLNKLSK